MPTLRLISYNVKGLNSPEKRSIVRAELRRLEGEIVFIQETHLTQSSQLYLASPQFPFVYSSNSNSTKKCGVAIIISKKLPWQFMEMRSDEDGRWVAVKGKIYGKLVTLCAVYAPNTDQIPFLEKTIIELREFAEGPVYLGGDLNLTLNPLVDSSKGQASISGSRLCRLRWFLLEHQLVDIWRLMHPEQRDYSFFSPPHGTYSRLDYFLISHSEVSLSSKVQIGNITISDHAGTDD